MGLKLRLRHGRIHSGTLGRYRNAQSSIVQSSIPIRGGMSGALLWPAYTLGTFGRVANLPKESYHTVADLCERGFISQLAGKHRLEVTQDADTISVTYHDDRFPALHLKRPRYSQDN